MSTSNRRPASTLLVRLASFALCMAAFASPVFAQSHRPELGMHHGFEDASTGPNNDADAARFLSQATFSPTLEEIAHLRQIGYVAWLDEQFAATPSLEVPYLDWVRGLPAGQNSVYQQQRMEAWLIHALGNPDPSAPVVQHKDQLRQKMAYQLSQIFVVSDRNGAVLFAPWSLASYFDRLTINAFGNYRNLLQDVTLHPAMGVYLSMIGNRKADAALNIRPDENYAREVLQLFSVGLNQLNLDGSNVLSAGQPVPTYNQNVVRGFAQVFTGWNWSDCNGADYANCSAPGNPYELPWQNPMVAFEAFHDNTTDKQLLNYAGSVLPSGVLVHGGTAAQEMTAALNNIFNHPNVGPFIAKQLIQRFITSNPTPAYVARIAAVFNNNGAGVRGDLKAVIKAILLDDEARFGLWQRPDVFGKPREPFLKLVQSYRALPTASANGRLRILTQDDTPYGQSPLHSPSVFNFYRPNFQQPGEIRAAGLVSPEFQITTDTLIVSGPNDLDWKTFYFYQGSSYSYAQDPDVPLIDANRDKTLTDAQMVDRYNILFMSGSMSPFMRQTLLPRLANMTGGGPLPEQDLQRHKVQQLLYLVLTSPEYAVQK
jgi:uncharacterized protein (DUF1800 family)